MNIDNIEQFVYKIAAVSAANVAMDKFNIDSMILDVSNNQMLQPALESAVLFAASEVGSYGLSIATGVQPPSLQQTFSMSTLEAFVGSTAAYYLINQTDIQLRLERAVGNNVFARAAAQSVVYEMAGQIAAMVTPMIMDVY